MAIELMAKVWFIEHDEHTHGSKSEEKNQILLGRSGVIKKKSCSVLFPAKEHKPQYSKLCKVRYIKRTDLPGSKEVPSSLFAGFIDFFSAFKCVINMNCILTLVTAGTRFIATWRQEQRANK